MFWVVIIWIDVWYYLLQSGNYGDVGNQSTGIKKTQPKIVHEYNDDW